MKLVTERSLDFFGNFGEGGGVCCALEAFEKCFALLRGDVELARGFVGNVGLDYVLNFFAEGLDCN